MEESKNINDLILHKLSIETQQIYDSIDKQLIITANDLKSKINDDIINKIKNTLTIQIQPTLFDDNYRKIECDLNIDILSQLDKNEYVICTPRIFKNLEELEICYVTNYLSCIFMVEHKFEIKKKGTMRLPNDYIDILISILMGNNSIDVFNYCFGDDRKYKTGAVGILKESLVKLLNEFETIFNKYFARHSVDSDEFALEKEINDFLEMSNHFYSESGIAKYNHEKQQFYDLKTNFESEIGQKLFIEQKKQLSIKNTKLHKLCIALDNKQHKLQMEIDKFKEENQIYDLNLFM